MKTKLEDLKPNVTVQGVLPNSLVQPLTVVILIAMGEVL